MLTCRCHMLLDVSLKLHDVVRHVVDAGDLWDIADQLSKLRRSHPSTVPHVVDHKAPRVQAIQDVGILERASGLAMDGDVEETPEDLAQPEDVQLGHPLAGLLVDVDGGDLLLVVLLRPLGHCQENSALGAEVPSHGAAPFLSVRIVAAGVPK